MFEVWGRDVFLGGYQKILSNNVSDLNKSLRTLFTELKTCQADKPGMLSINDSSTDTLYVAVVFPHPEGTPTESRAHCISHIVSFENKKKESFFSNFSKYSTEVFFHGNETDALNTEPELVSELDTEAILKKMSLQNNIRLPDLDNDLNKKLVAYLKANPNTAFNITINPVYEYQLFLFLSTEFPDKAIGLNLESNNCDFKININCKITTYFIKQLDYRNIPEIDHCLYSFDFENIPFKEYRSKIITTYNLLSKSDIETAETFWAKQKSIISTIRVEQTLILYKNNKGILLDMLLFESEFSPLENAKRSLNSIDLSTIYDLQVLKISLESLSLWPLRKKNVKRKLYKLIYSRFKINI